MNNIYFTLQKIISYNALLNFIIGERGVGKSYDSKIFVAQRFIKRKKQFVYLRRYKTELKEAMMKNGNPIFFDQIKKIQCILMINYVVLQCHFQLQIY